MSSVSTDRRRGINSGAAIKVACICATTADITLSGEQTIDGITTDGTRVLVKDQSDASENGVYLSGTSSWTREPDFDGTYDVTEGTVIPVSRGTASAATFWRITNTGTITIGTTSLTISQVALDSGAILEDGSNPMAAHFDPSAAATYDLGNSATWRDLNLSRNLTMGGTAHLDDAQLLLDKGADVASAGALTLGTDGNYFDITGTTSITSITSLGIGTVVTLHFDSSLTLTYHATDLVLPGAENIQTGPGDEATFVEYASGDWRCIGYVQALRPIADLSGEFYGLGTVLDSDVDHDVQIAVGKCADSTNTVMLERTSVLTKRIDANFAVGDDAGGFPSALTLSNATTYHYFLLGHRDGSTDAGWDTSLTASNLLSDAQGIYSGWVYYRRIASHLTDGSANITAYYQHGDNFWWSASTLPFDYNGAMVDAATDVTLTVPTGIAVLAEVTLAAEHNSGAAQLCLAAKALSDPSPSATNYTVRTTSSALYNASTFYILTDTSGVVVHNASGTGGDFKLWTRGWIDTRGKV